MPVKESLLIKCFGTSLCQRKWFDRDTEILLKSIEKWNISFCLLYQLRFCQCTIIWRKKTSLLVLYKERMKTLKKKKINYPLLNALNCKPGLVASTEEGGRGGGKDRKGSGGGLWRVIPWLPTWSRASKFNELFIYLHIKIKTCIHTF